MLKKESGIHELCHHHISITEKQQSRPPSLADPESLSLATAISVDIGFLCISLAYRSHITRDLQHSQLGQLQISLLSSSFLAFLI